MSKPLVTEAVSICAHQSDKPSISLTQYPEMYRTTHDIAGESEFSFQDLVEYAIISASISAIDAIWLNVI